MKSDEDKQFKCAGTEKEPQNQKGLKKIMKVKGTEERMCSNRGGDTANWIRARRERGRMS